jgi:hypothetical protein
MTRGGLEIPRDHALLSPLASKSAADVVEALQPQQGIGGRQL